jgi:hypothetical protein
LIATFAIKYYTRIVGEIKPISKLLFGCSQKFYADYVILPYELADIRDFSFEEYTMLAIVHNCPFDSTNKRILGMVVTCTSRRIIVLTAR